MTAPEVSFVTTDAGFDALRPDWEACLERSAASSIFVSFDWLRAWWRHYSGGRALRIAVAREGAGVTGILPLYVGAAPLVPTIPARVLRLLGSGGDTSPDYLGPIVDEDRAVATIAALCRATVRSGGWDALDFTDVLDGSALVSATEAACLEIGMASVRSPASIIHVARLPASWADYLATLSRERVRTLQRKRRLCEKAGGRFFTWNGDPPLDLVVDRLAELHRLRWRDRADSYAFSSAAYLGFHREVMHALAARRQLRLYCLDVQGAMSAVVYCYAFRGEVSYFQSGFDPALHHLSPGLAVMSYAIEQAIAEGASVFDMLKGDYPHKAVWSNERRATVGIRSYRRGVRGALLRTRREVLARSRRGVAPADASGG